MPLTPETLPRHELIGLRARVTAAANQDLVGITGQVVDETKQTLKIEHERRDKMVPKAGTTITFALPSDSGAVSVDGDRLTARPARRTEANRGTIWHSD